MKPVSPYKNIEQYTRVILEPYQMNSDIKNSLKINLKKKVEKKCNKNGYIDEVYKILHIADGYLPVESLTACGIYDIKYHCKICLPVENSIIISQVKIINQELVATINGPIMTFIPRDNVDSTIWDIIDNYQHKHKKDIKLKIGDFVLIQIVNKRINKNDLQIKSIGKLLDLATEEQIKKYFNTNDISEQESNFII